MSIANSERELYIKEQGMVADLSVKLGVDFLTINYLKELAKREGVTMNELFNDMINVFKSHTQNLHRTSEIFGEILGAVGAVFPDHSFPRSGFAYKTTEGESLVCLIDIPASASNEWESRALKLSASIASRYGITTTIKLVYSEDTTSKILEYMDQLKVSSSDLHYVK